MAETIIFSNSRNPDRIMLLAARLNKEVIGYFKNCNPDAKALFEFRSNGETLIVIDRDRIKAHIDMTTYGCSSVDFTEIRSGTCCRVRFASSRNFFELRFGFVLCDGKFELSDDVELLSISGKCPYVKVNGILCFKE